MNRNGGLQRHGCGVSDSTRMLRMTLQVLFTVLFFRDSNVEVHKQHDQFLKKSSSELNPSQKHLSVLITLHATLEEDEDGKEKSHKVASNTHSF